MAEYILFCFNGRFNLKKRRCKMRSIRMITIMMIFASLACMTACGEKKTASHEGNEDIAAVLQ